MPEVWEALEDTALFCSYCGEKIRAAGQDDTPLYQAEVKGLLRSGRIVVYRDRTEFVVSPVQKMVFPYASLVAVRKGLDRINFIMEDGRTEACMVNRKNLHEAFYTIERASRPYLAARSEQLRQKGVRYSFPSSPAGLGGMLGGGLLNIADEECEFCAPDGKGERILYRDVKAVRASSMGALEFCFYDGSRKAYTVEKEMREEVIAFLRAAIEPFIAQHKAQLLEQGIYFSLLSGQGFAKGTLDIFADRVEYKGEAGSTDTVAFADIRAISLYDAALELALTDGASKTFQLDREDADTVAEARAFLTQGIAPYVEQRTKGFDLRFGIAEQIEVNAERSVFHILRQNGREISGEDPLESLVKAEAIQTKAGRAVVSALLSARGGNTDTPPEERFSDIGVQLQMREAGEDKEAKVCMASFAFGTARTQPDYQRGTAELKNLFAFLQTHCPDCTCIPLPEAPQAPLPAARQAAALPTAGAEPISAAPYRSGEAKESRPAVGEAGGSPFETLIGGISDFVDRCNTPMTIAIQGDWATGSGSFIRMVYNDLEKRYHGNVFWLNTWQFFQFDLGEQFPMQLANKLIELLGGAINEETKHRAKALAQGMLNIATGVITKGNADGQMLSDAIFRENSLANTLEQKVRAFTEIVHRKANAGKGKVIIFVDDLNRLAPDKVAMLLESMRYFFDCPGCVFIVAVDRQTVARGRQGTVGANTLPESADAYFGRLFKTAFHVPKGSLDLEKYVRNDLERASIGTDDAEEVRHYAALAGLSVGHDPKELERVFNAFMLLKSLAGDEDFATGPRRLAVFGLLCMQSTFPTVYRRLVQAKDSLTPASLARLLAAPAEEGAVDSAAFAAFAEALGSALRIEFAQGASEQDCRDLAKAIAISAITSA